jgi:DNA polymerase
VTEPLQLGLFGDSRRHVLNTPDYPEFRERLAAFDCRACGLWQGRTRLVVDRGNPGAGLLVVGEAPGEQEDLQGLAFVGRAGRLLDDLMASAGLDTRREMLITNVVKCRPPQNRVPSPEEARACLPFLRRQMELVRPSCVLLLGATAARHLFPLSVIGPLRDRVGTFFEDPDHPGVRFMLLYHPAYLLRDPRKKKDAWEHVLRFRDWWLSRGG